MIEAANLHTHDEFSLLDGAMKNSAMVALAKEQGLRALAQTNHGNVDGALKHIKACKEVGLQPIIGCEAYILLPGEVELLPKKRIKRHHLTLLARDRIGFQKLMKALTRGWETATGLNNFSGIPIDTPLNEDWKDHIVVLTGCANSPFWKEKGTDWLGKYAETFGEDLYAETMAIEDFPRQEEVNRLALLFASYGFKHVITTDAHYCRPEDHEMHQVLLAVGTKQRWTDPYRFKFDSKLNYMRPPQEVFQALTGKLHWDEKIANQGFLNTLEVAEKCSFKMDPVPVDLPKVLPDGIDEVQWTIEQAYKRMVKLGLAGKQVYEERFEREIGVLIEGGFIRYILLVADLIRWAKSAGISCGPGRGSVSGSLICYLLEITQVDPIKYKLIFERFLNAGRIDIPDVDMDFEDRKRWMIEQYLREKYGEHNVAKVATYALLKGKLAIKDVARVFDVPGQDVKKMCDSIVIRGDADARASFTIADAIEQFEYGKEFSKKYPQVIKNAIALEGLTKQTGIHAAGLVVAAKDLRQGDHCAIISRDGERVCNWDKKDLEKMGLMKLDVLGLNTLSVLEDTRQLVLARHQKEIVWTEVDLEDRETYEKTITPGLTALCFQIGSRGLQKYCAQLKPKDFKTTVDASALWRPGCLRSGMTGMYTECHQGIRKPQYLNKYHEELTKDTYGQIVYQEQIMFMFNRLAGMPWSRTDLVRKIVSKKGGTAEFMKFKEDFVNGCLKQRTLTREQASETWDKLQFAGMYSFNAAHSVAYGMIGFWTAWAKTHYPVEFCCSYLNWGATGGKEGMSQITKLDEALREVKRLNLKIDPPDINLSQEKWSIGPKNQLVASLAEIKGISRETAQLIIEARIKAGGQFQTITDLVANINRRRVNRGILHKMVLAGALDSILGDKLNSWQLWFDELYEFVLSPTKLEEAYKVLAPRVEEEWALGQAEIMDQKSALLRFSEIGGKEFAQFRNFLRSKMKIIDLEHIKKLDGEVWCFGVVTSLKYGYREGFKIGDSANQLDQVGTKGMMGGAYGNLDDGTGYLMAVFLSEYYAAHKEQVETIIGKRILVKGKYNQKRHNMIVKDVWTLEELSAAQFRGLRLNAMAGSKDGWYSKHKADVLACTKCDLRPGCARPVPGSTGQLQTMIVGEAPGFHEDKEGRGFVGPAGRVLWAELGKLGIRREMVHLENTIKCRPKDNKFPGLPYIGKCPWLTEAIQKAKPVSILVLGNRAMFYFNGKPTGISEMNGRTEWNSKANAWVTYCLHPSAVLHDELNRPAFQEGIQEFVRVLAEIS